MDSKYSSFCLLYFHHRLCPTVCFLVGKLRQQKKKNKSQLSSWKIAVLVKVGWCEIENDWNELQHHLWVQLFPIPLSCQEAVTFMWCPVQMSQGCQKSDASPCYIHWECETQNKEALHDGGRDSPGGEPSASTLSQRSTSDLSPLSLPSEEGACMGLVPPTWPSASSLSCIPHTSNFNQVFSTQLWSLHLTVKSGCLSGAT